MLSPICGENCSEIPLKMNLAFKNKEKAQDAYRHQCNHFGFSVGLVPKAKGSMLANILTVVLNSLEEEYPPSGHDIYETASV